MDGLSDWMVEVWHGEAVRIPDGRMPEGTALHLYLFFGNKAGTRFSPSVYVAT